MKLGKRLRTKRGQTLVLMGLTLLLLTLLVLMTLGLGVRVHERTEQQVVADAVAYSEAVATARTFNVTASLNRTIIAQMAAVAAGQSLLSWAGFYHGCLNQARDLLMDYQASGACGDVTAPLHRVLAEDRRLIDIWEPPGGGYEGILGLDRNAGNYLKTVLYPSVVAMANTQQELYQAMVDKASGERGIAAQIVTAANRGMPVPLSAPEQKTTEQERGKAVEDQQKNPAQMMRILMATLSTQRFLSSREASGVTGGLSAAEYVRRRLQEVVGVGGLQVQIEDVGLAYVGAHGPHPTTGATDAETQGYEQSSPVNVPEWLRWHEIKTDVNVQPRGVWAEDYGHFRFISTDTGCVLTDAHNESFGYLVASGPGDNLDNHMWQRGNQTYGDYRELNDESGRVSDPPPIRHGFDVVPEDQTPPLVWPVFVDYKESALNANDLYGQPKSVVPIVRDYAASSHTDPWELHFKFRFTAQGSDIDLRSKRAAALGDGKAIAIATGLTYYHRGGGHWKEPPNFVNPFWRATLVASDVDEKGGNVGQTLKDTLTDLGEGDQASLLSKLQGRGFEALP